MRLHRCDIDFRARTVVKWVLGLVITCSLLQYGFNLVVISNSAWMKFICNNNNNNNNALINSTTRIHYSNLTNTTDQSNDVLICPLIPPNRVGHIDVNMTVPYPEDLEAQNANLEAGGTWHPSSCRARYRVAIVIPYRDREEHLRVFLQHMHPFLQGQQLDYGIYIVEQAGSTKFNRAMLMNIGFKEANALRQYDCYIFHDIDLLPEDDRNIYSCPDQPRHMSAAIDKKNYRLPYQNIFGGVGALTTSQFLRINGFSNMFFGWGGEDDDLFNRIQYHGYRLTRYSMEIARYRTLKHKKAQKSAERMHYLRHGHERFTSDGLNSLKYERLALKKMKLYTWIHVSINMTAVLTDSMTTTQSER